MAVCNRMGDHKALVDDISMSGVEPNLTVLPIMACRKWAQQDLNLRPSDYESAALTN